MNKQILTLFGLSLIGTGVGYVLSNSYKFGLCYSDLATNTYNVSCHTLYETIGNPFYYGMPALALVFFILLATPQAFSVWKKFALWFVPLATLLFAFYPDPGSGDFLSPYPEQVFQWISALYIVISIVIIGIVSLRKPISNP